MITQSSRIENRYEELAHLLAAHKVGLLAAFGSQAKLAAAVLRGEDPAGRPGSDLDLAVAFLEFFPEENRSKEAELRTGLAGIFHPLKVHLVFLEEQRAELQWEAIQGEVLFCAVEDFEKTLKKRVLARYADWYEWWC